MTSFQAKTDWIRQKQSENKNYRSDQFLPDSLQRIQKKLKKIKKHHYGFFSSQNRLEKLEKERK